MSQKRSRGARRSRYVSLMTATASRPDFDTLFAAFTRRDSEFEGLAVMAVQTTGIFCRSTCPARKPRPENVTFFPTAAEALAAGYRPCQRCRPLEPVGTTPGWLKPVLAAVDADPARRWTTQDLNDAGVDPARARRWFQAQHGLSFLAYLRARRLGQAFSRIQEGSPVLEAALSADFDSVSGFCDALTSHLGHSAAAPRDRHVLRVAQIPSPLGPVLLAGDERAVHLIEFWDRRLLEKQFADLKRRTGAVFFPGTTPVLDGMQRELDAYFAGPLRTFTTPVQLSGTPHQQRVWQALCAVPPGDTWTYGQLARHLGQPAAARSVATAVGQNRLAIVIPCHRIVGAQGQLTGYSGGLWRKHFLLDLEKRANPA